MPRQIKMIVKWSTGHKEIRKFDTYRDAQTWLNKVKSYSERYKIYVNDVIVA